AVSPKELIPHRGNFKGCARLGEERNVELPGLRRDAPFVVRKEELLAADVLRILPRVLAELLTERRDAGAVDGVAVHLQPPPDRAQDVGARFWNDPVRRRTDVQ